MSLRSVMRKAAKKLVRLSGRRNDYQAHRSAGTEERWKLIEQHLTDADRSLLDIGCNLGILTARAARRGMFALGFDVLPETIEFATRRHRGIDGLAFCFFKLTPVTVSQLPDFDAILCLSVHHYWFRDYGGDASWAMLEGLCRRSRKLFFEPSVRRRKYGAGVPADFVEHDTAYVEALTRRSVPSLKDGRKQFRLLGETPAPGEEQFRPLFLID